MRNSKIKNSSNDSQISHSNFNTPISNQYSLSNDFIQNFLNSQKDLTFEYNESISNIPEGEDNIIFQIPTQSLSAPFSEVKLTNTQTKSTKSSQSLNVSCENSSLQKKSRKWGRDSFQKKIKCMFMKFVSSFFQTKLDLTYMDKISQKVITNVTKRFNRDLLNMDLQSFGISYLGLTNTNFEGNNSNFDFSKVTLAKLFEEYTISMNYEKDLLRIKEKEDECYLSSLKEYLSDFIRYYSRSTSPKK